MATVKTWTAGDRVEIMPGWVEISALDSAEIDAEPWYKWVPNEEGDGQGQRKEWSYPFGYFTQKMDPGEKIETGQMEPFTIIVVAGSIAVEGRSHKAPERTEEVQNQMNRIAHTWRTQDTTEEQYMSDLRAMSELPDPEDEEEDGE